MTMYDAVIRTHLETITNRFCVVRLSMGTNKYNSRGKPIQFTFLVYACNTCGCWFQAPFKYSNVLLVIFKRLFFVLSQNEKGRESWRVVQPAQSFLFKFHLRTAFRLARARQTNYYLTLLVLLLLLSYNNYYVPWCIMLISLWYEKRGPATTNKKFLVAVIYTRVPVVRSRKILLYFVPRRSHCSHLELSFVSNYHCYYYFVSIKKRMDFSFCLKQNKKKKRECDKRVERVYNTYRYVRNVQLRFVDFRFVFFILTVSFAKKKLFSKV